MSYGEPWRQHKEFPYIIMTDDGLGIAEFEPTFVQGVGYSADHTEANRKAARVCAAVNALEGIRNPAAVKDVIKAARDICEEGFHDFMWVSDRINVITKALAALDGEAG